MVYKDNLFTNLQTTWRHKRARGKSSVWRHRHYWRVWVYQRLFVSSECLMSLTVANLELQNRFDCGGRIWSRMLQGSTGKQGTPKLGTSPFYKWWVLRSSPVLGNRLMSLSHFNLSLSEAELCASISTAPPLEEVCGPEACFRFQSVS